MIKDIITGILIIAITLLIVGCSDSKQSIEGDIIYEDPYMIITSEQKQSDKDYYLIRKYTIQDNVILHAWDLEIHKSKIDGLITRIMIEESENYNGDSQISKSTLS